MVEVLIINWWKIKKKIRVLLYNVTKILYLILSYEIVSFCKAISSITFNEAIQTLDTLNDKILLHCLMFFCVKNER